MSEGEMALWLAERYGINVVLTGEEEPTRWRASIPGDPREGWAVGETWVQTVLSFVDFWVRPPLP